MKILALADIVPYPPNTGIKIRTFNIVRELARCGDDVFLVCFNHPVFISDEETKRRYHEELSRFCREVHILEIPGEGSEYKTRLRMLRNLFQADPFRVRRYDSRECRDLLRRLDEEHDFDILHLDKTEFFIYAENVLPHLTAVPTNHNVESMLFKRRAAHESTPLRRFFASLQHRKTVRYEKHALASVPAFVTCTDLDAEHFRRELGIDTPSITIDNGVNTDHYHPLSDDRGDYVLLIGAQNKNAAANFDATNHFIDSIWPRIKAGSPHLTLRIVGRNPDRSILDLPHLDDRIEVLGFVEDEREHLGRAAALVVPLRIGGGSRLKIFTAMSMGTPVVSTTIGAEGIAHTPGENILIADDAGTFADAVLSVHRDEELARRLSSGGRDLAVTRYDWASIGRRLHDFYEGLAGSR